jgi:hypothetical protein
MALTVETGAGVLNANSYVTLAEARAYASARGVTLTAVDADLEKILVKATDYLESFRDKYKGYKLLGFGYLQWPRSGVVIDGFNLAQTALPVELKNAQAQLAIEISNAVDPLPTFTTGTGTSAIKREKVGDLEVEYAVTPDDTQTAPIISKVDALLLPLLSFGTSGSGCIPVTRV